MECDGICHEYTTGYIKVTCPGVYQNFPLKLKISMDGSVNKAYKDYCQEQQHHATLAYNNNPGWFEVDSEGNLIEHPVDHQTGVNSQVSQDYEILQSFFENYHITITWVDCNDTMGMFEEETGTWTGALGKVTLLRETIK